jgi:hypothetical protein
LADALGVSKLAAQRKYAAKLTACQTAGHGPSAPMGMTTTPSARV